jgi:hypothetical protein
MLVTHRIYDMAMSHLYPAYVAKAVRKGRTRTEVDMILCWLTGHSQVSLDAAVAAPLTVAEFFAAAPEMNPARRLVTGTVCGVRVEAVEDPLMGEIRRLDKMVDGLARGRPLAKILRT